MVFNTIVPPGASPFFEELYNYRLRAAAGTLICTYFDENFLNMVPAAHVEGLWGLLRLLPGRRALNSADLARSQASSICG